MEKTQINYTIHHVIRIFLSLFKKSLYCSSVHRPYFLLLFSPYLHLAPFGCFLLLLTSPYLTIDGSWLKEEAAVNTENSIWRIVVCCLCLTKILFFLRSSNLDCNHHGKSCTSSNID